MKKLDRHLKHSLHTLLAVASCAALALALTSTAAAASNCEAISAQIDAKIRAAGVEHFALSTVDVGAATGGKVVGTCDLGSKKIIYVQGNSAANAAVEAVPSTSRPAATRSGSGGILTECRDGSVSHGGDCKR